MGFETLLGNARLKENLRAGVSRGKLSHSYLISGPEGAGKRTLARLLAAAALCKNENKPCLACSACRKVMADTHPDYITVDDPEKKTVSVELIRQARADMYVRPNEGDKKIYCIPRAQDMRPEAQNALLKVMEEPPAYGVFLLLTDNPEKLLPTIRSRCAQLRLEGLSPEIMESALQKAFPNAEAGEIQGAIRRSGGYLGQAKALLQEGAQTDPKTEGFAGSFAKKDQLLLLQTLAPMEKMHREQLIPLLQQWKEILLQALTYRSGVQAQSALAQSIGSARSAKEILTAIRHLDTAQEYAQGNVSVGAICGYLVWALR
ncbi:MAG: DNA polymerase III subunit [Oscillospiraceae bacterium]|nr:DNA polymerase III subunit [Oscillospiraceae bacterium]